MSMTVELHALARLLDRKAARGEPLTVTRDELAVAIQEHLAQQFQTERDVSDIRKAITCTR